MPVQITIPSDKVPWYWLSPNIRPIRGNSCKTLELQVIIIFTGGPSKANEENNDNAIFLC